MELDIKGLGSDPSAHYALAVWPITFLISSQYIQYIELVKSDLKAFEM